MKPTIEPTKKQHEAYELLQDDTTRFILFGGGAGGGKAQALDSKVYTPDGYKEMGDIEVGDKVLGQDGAKEVLAIHPQGVKDMYEVEFSDGATARFTEDHLFDCWIAGYGQNRRKVRSLKEIMELKSEVIIPFGVAEFNGSDNLGIDPYVLGAMLGDGGLTKHLTFTTADEQMIDELKKRLPESIDIRKTGDIQYSLVQDEHNDKGYPVNELAQEFREYGLLPIKCSQRFVPPVYLYNSVEVRKDVLRGLLDTDGYVDSRGHFSFTSKSKWLAENVQFLVRSLGGKATLKEVEKGFKDYTGTYYTVYIRIKNEKDYVLLKRKKKLARKEDKHELGRKIIHIEKVGKEPAQCITVEDSLYLTDDFILTHNSWLGCEWLITFCYIYPESRWFIARKELKRLMKSTFITFRKVCSFHNIPEDDWKIDGKYNYIEFANGSQIDLLDVAHKPSDPEYERFGSSEYTGGWIEEAGEVDFGAYDVLKSRIGRHKNNEFNLIPKMLLTANPTKGWLYRKFYIPWKNEDLAEEKAFVQSLYDDNPYTAEEYGKQLSQISNPATIQRLKYGNWEYDDDPAKLFEYDALVDLFTNTIDSGKQKFIVADVARYGQDKTVIGYWKGLKLKDVEIIESSSTTQVAEVIKRIATDKRVPFSQIIIDEDGVGGGVVDQLGGVKGFMANSVPFEVWDPRRNKKVRANFKNLKAQCYFKLSDLVNKHKIAIDVEDESFKEQVIEELEQIKQKNPDKENKLNVIPKDEIKDTLGHSPDIADMLMMRMFFEFKKPKQIDKIKRQMQKHQARKRITKNQAR